MPWEVKKMLCHLVNVQVWHSVKWSFCKLFNLSLSHRILLSISHFTSFCHFDNMPLCHSAKSFRKPVSISKFRPSLTEPFPSPNSPVEAKKWVPRLLADRYVSNIHLADTAMVKDIKTKDFMFSFIYRFFVLHFRYLWMHLYVQPIDTNISRVLIGYHPVNQVR